MQVVHVAWKAKESFENNGNLYFWIEHHKEIKKKKYYPYQLTHKELDVFAGQYLSGLELIPETLELSFISNAEEESIPSPVISNIVDFKNIEVQGFQKSKVFGLKPTPALSFLKNLNFISYYLDEDIVLGDDAKFWIKMGFEISRLIKYDQYVPSVTIKDSKSALSCFSKWEPLSSNYNSLLEKVAYYMPISACACGRRQDTTGFPVDE